MSAISTSVLHMQICKAFILKNALATSVYSLFSVNGCLAAKKPFLWQCDTYRPNYLMNVITNLEISQFF